jgi:xanthine dehydrogenase accessory factor
MKRGAPACRMPGMTMQPALDDLLARLAREDGVLVQVTSTQGSVPREAGTWMAVWPGGALTGTIGGGQLEYQAVAAALALLAERGGDAGHRAQRAEPPEGGAGGEVPADGATLRYPLGPSLGQCCGGVVFLRYRRIRAADLPALREELTAPLAPVALFGGGHVGAAIVRLLSALPYAVRWIDSRDGVFPPEVPAQVQTEHSEPVHGAVAALPAGARVLIMSFSHAEDLDIVIACLQRLRATGDLPYVGLIGSKTKWATFRHRLQARGFSEEELARITCPIGMPGIAGKEPEVIAVAVAAQLLQVAPPEPGLPVAQAALAPQEGRRPSALVGALSRPAVDTPAP